MEKIGLIGLGIMGRGMAVNLLKAGYPVTVYNRTKSKARELAAEGAVIADTPKAAAEGADVVITMLADPPAVEAITLGPDGVVEGLKEGAVLIDASTVDPATTAKVARAAAGKGASFLDTPVAGSKQAALDGQLVLMVGGAAEVLERCRPILEVVSRKIVYAGDTGSGSQLKLAFNLIVSHMAAALAEGLVMGTKAGLDPNVILETVMAGVTGSKFYEWKGGCIINRDFSTNFSLKLMHKDLNLIMKNAYDLNIPLPVTAAVKELYSEAKAEGDPEEDFCSVVKALERSAGVEVG